MNWLAIDFGTSICSAAIIGRDGIPQKIPFSNAPQGCKYDLPTEVFITNDGDVKVGYEAQAECATNPINFEFGFKLNLNKLDDTRPDIEGNGKNWTYTDFCSAILKKIKEEAEKFSKTQYPQVVITIPVLFERKKGQERILAAAKNAGFEKVEFVLEPQGAAIYFNYILSTHFKQKNITALIYDLGGGTFDPAIIEISNTAVNEYKIIAGGEGIECGGILFDGYIQRDFKEKFKLNTKLSGKENIKLKIEINEKCRDKIKHYLSGSNTASFDVPYQYQNNTSDCYSLSRDEFNNWLKDPINNTITHCNNLLKQNELSWSNIDVVLFVGGSCKIPYVQKAVEAYVNQFNDKIEFIHEMYRGQSVDSQYAVCQGATLFINHKKNTTMNAQTYKEKRDELLSILGKIVKIEGMHVDYKNEFEAIHKKCLENQFDIVLVGEFQGGKSTTFNTFCDGREISPRGAMVKTSACRITAQNIADPAIKEYAEVTWKTDRELLLCFEDILAKHIDKEVDENQKTKILEYVYKPGDDVPSCRSDILKLDNVKHVQLINNILAKEWESYNQNKAGYGTDVSDILRIATIIMNFKSDTQLRQIKSKTKFSISDISKMVVFPSDWETKFTQGAKVSFRPEEIIFAFIAGVDCHIHSENLARLGCAITDCPGLFASKWDTQVAIDTIPKSDAILYLLGGDKAVGQGELKALTEISRIRNVQKKLYYSINMKQPRPIVENSIIPNDVSAINNIGLNITEEDIKKYHALLAFLAELGTQYLNGTLDETSKNHFLDLSKKTMGMDMPLEQAWVMQVNQHLMFVFPPQMVANLSFDSIVKIKESCGVSLLFDEIEQFIVKSKAESILITNGSEKASDALSDIERKLKNRENEAKKSVESRKTELLIAENKLNDFQSKAKDIVNKSFDDKVFSLLVDDYVDQVFTQSTDEIAKESAPKLDKKFTASFALKTLLNKAEKKSQKAQAIAKPILQETMKDIFGKNAKIWVEGIRKKENENYSDTVGREVDRINAELISKWESIIGVEKDIPNVNLPDAYSIFGTHTSIDNIKISDFLKGIAMSSLLETIIGIIIFTLFGGWISWVIQLITMLSDKIKGKDVKEFDWVIETNNTKKIEEQLKSQLAITYGNVESRKNIKVETLKSLKNIGVLFKEEYKDSLKKQENKFQKETEEAKKNMQQSNEERERVALEAHTLRTEKIEPLNKEIQKFATVTKKILKISG